MPEPQEIRTLAAEKGLHTCPACGYQLGFHTSFIKADGTDVSTHAGLAGEIYHIILICPECGARYDVGWKALLIL
jgi:predicted RNA-binding Zn-ribbon protein involved in translation (DUF1610 family)